MAYPIPENAILSVTLRGILDGQTVMNVLHYQVVGNSVIDGAAALNDFWTNFLNVGGGLYEAWQNSMTSDVTQLACDLQWIKPNRFRKLTRLPAVRTGGAAPPAMPANTGYVITKQGQVATRHGIGSMHVCGIPKTWAVASLLAAGGIAVSANLAARLPEIYALGGGGSIQPIIYNRDPLATTQVNLSDTTVQTTIRVERRRTVGLGI